MARSMTPTVDALRHAKSEGLRLILVTGRELTDLFNTFAAPTCSIGSSAENGARAL